MFRFLLRSAGFVCIAVAFAAMVVDGTRSLAAAHLLFFSIDDTASWLGPTPWAAGKRAMTAISNPSVRDALLAALGVPTFAAFAAGGAILLLLGRRPPPPIGFSSRR